MKICVTAIEDNLDADVDPRFGRCKYFLIIDVETMEVNSISNDNLMASGGAGIQAAQMVAKTGANTVITGNIGPNAFQTLSAAGVKVITGVSGNIKDVINKFKNGEIKEINSPSVGSHFGMGGTGNSVGRGGNQ
ncbi:MAG: NifB/NifX family molybdenum-iron cluster-binding protein [Candidatus Thermoplasmatota archaeon]|nr:NifB/NifX family molybdenum-iron cluster-binding protein [Candidatus Thermoplasmatota archaeon]